MADHREGEIRKWAATKGYDVHNCVNVIQLLNEIDYQARECGEAVERVRNSTKQKL